MLRRCTVLWLKTERFPLLVWEAGECPINFYNPRATTLLKHALTFAMASITSRSFAITAVAAYLYK